MVLLIRCGVMASIIHVITDTLIVYWLFRNGIHFYSEALRLFSPISVVTGSTDRQSFVIEHIGTVAWKLLHQPNILKVTQICFL